ncbi:MAG TPA: hypothetical protein VF170_05380 [Planctomycetaceae bacterium]
MSLLVAGFPGSETDARALHTTVVFLGPTFCRHTDCSGRPFVGLGDHVVERWAAEAAEP